VEIIRAFFSSRFGACWKCAALSVALLAVSTVAFAASLAWLPGAAAFLASVPTGFFAVWSGIHAVFWVARRLPGRGRRTATREQPAKGCCG
jgi:hypothetical protein